MNDTSKCYCLGDTICFRDGGFLSYFDIDGKHEIYADFSVLKGTGFFEDESITTSNIELQPVNGYGFKINDYLIPCYSEDVACEIHICLYNENGKEIKQIKTICEVMNKENKCYYEYDTLYLRDGGNSFSTR